MIKDSEYAGEENSRGGEAVQKALPPNYVSLYRGTSNRPDSE